MKTYKTNIENMTVNYRIEIVRDIDNVYYVNMTAETGEYVKGLPEYLPYKELKKAVKCFTGCELPALKSLTFEGKGRKQYAHIERTGHQTPKVGDVLTDKKWGHDYYRIEAIEQRYNDTRIKCNGLEMSITMLDGYVVMTEADNEHTIADLPGWVCKGATIIYDDIVYWIDGEIVGVSNGCIWFKDKRYGTFGAPHGWTYDRFLRLYNSECRRTGHLHGVDLRKAVAYTLEGIAEIRAAYERDGLAFDGDREGTCMYYIEQLLKGRTSYQFGNCRFDCKLNEDGTWDVHAYDTDGEDSTFKAMPIHHAAGMFNDLFGTWGSGNLPDPDGGNEPDYYSEYQKLGHQEARPTVWLEKATSEEQEAYYRACVELERMAGDGLPLVIRADSADLSVNPWNALEKRVKTARVFHLGDRVKVKDGNSEVTGIVNGIRCNEGSLALGGWCTHYNIQWDKQYQYTTGCGTATGCGNIGPERIELIERAEFCTEPTSEWLQPGEKVAHYLDYGDGTGDWLIGNVTGYELCDDGTVIVIYGEYRTPLKGMVKYRPEMDGKAA